MKFNSKNSDFIFIFFILLAIFSIPLAHSEEEKVTAHQREKTTEDSKKEMAEIERRIAEIEAQQMHRARVLQQMQQMQQVEDASFDYGALVPAMQYLNQKWVDEPRQRDHELQMQQMQNNKNNVRVKQAPTPTCVQVPVYSTINGQFLMYQTVCQ